MTIDCCAATGDVRAAAITVASASFFIAFSSPAGTLVSIANIALMQASAQRTLDITIDHFVMAVTAVGAEPRHAGGHRCRGLSARQNGKWSLVIGLLLPVAPIRAAC